jgi:hypothetical protein
MTDWELRTWLTERARACRPALARSGPDGSARQALVVRVEVQADSIEAAEEQLTDLMMDMRLLGLRPTVVPAPGDGL